MSVPVFQRDPARPILTDLLGYLRTLLNCGGARFSGVQSTYDAVPAASIFSEVWRGPSHETEHQGALRDGGADRSRDGAGGRVAVAGGTLQAAEHFAALSRAAFREAAPRGPRGQRAGAGRRLPARPGGVRDPGVGHSRGGRRDGERDAHRRGRERRSPPLAPAPVCIALTVSSTAPRMSDTRISDAARPSR